MSAPGAPSRTDKARSPGLPREMGYRLPAEWARHEATWLSWPHNAETWPGKLGEAAQVWVDIIRALSPGEKVHLLVDDAGEEKSVRRRLDTLPSKANVLFHHIPTNDAWMRDSGPLFICRPSRTRPVAVTHWGYNAWGGKWPPFDRDQQIPGRVAEALGLPVFRPGMILEGGSIDTNGNGVLLTTEACLLNPNRNPGLSRVEIEQRLRDYLAVRHVLWLYAGVAGDDTDGHIDNLARFVAPDTIVALVEEDPRDENYQPLHENWERLRRMKGPDGRPFRLIPLPTPGHVLHEGRRLPASYANFYIGNRAVLLPVYGHPNDARALEVLQGLFPDRALVGIPCRDLVIGLGGIHCITQQQPAQP
ncbi:MAG: agmatine deiminase family protein [Planctomycetes bacterium]|nr:agmatine deiminase family protein [Planctomycetota bacterium]